VKKRSRPFLLLRLPQTQQAVKDSFSEEIVSVASHARDKAQNIKFEEKILKLRLDSKSSFQVQLLSLRQLQADFSISTKALFPVSMLCYGTLT
jgi:hypothetical protein